MNVYDAIMKRRTIRKFEQKTVSEDNLVKLVDCARVAAYGANVQPLKFMIVNNSEILQKIYPMTKWAGYLADGAPKEDERPAAYIAILGDSSIKSNKMYEVEAGAAVTTMMLEAVEMGLGTCWLGAIQRDEIKKLLDANDFINYNFDLIYGWPKSTKEAFIEDLNFILNLNPKHISIYPLAIEEGTYLHNIHLQPIEDDEYAEIYYEAKKLLKDKGFFRYEVSNFAKIGYESKHNLTYWLGEDYLAAGLGATSFYNGVRATRTRSILKYIDGKYILNENVEDFFEQKNDFIMLNLRLDKGFTFKQYYDKFKSEFLEEYKKEHKEEEIEKKIDELRETKKIDRSKVSKTGVIVKGIDNCLVKLSRCCNPLPGDEIIGYITKGRGVSVHRADCVNCKELLTDEQRLIDVSWYKENNASYVTELEVYANDRAGLLADITVAVGELKAKIVSINAKTVQNNRVAIINIGVEVENIDMLNKVIKTVRKVDSVYDVHRQK